MEVSSIPPADAPKSPAATAPATQLGAQSSGNVALLADADIRPLDTAGALQILVAEVRAGLELALQAAITQGTAIGQTPATPQNPAQAAYELLRMFLQEIPGDASNAPAWTGGMVRVEAAIRSGVERALGVVSQWRDVPAAAVDAVKETRVLLLSALGDEPLNPLWLRPEWMGLAPKLYRFRRRRRIARRRLTDPDYATESMDDDGAECPR